jgi:hypothetical protein
LNIKIALLLEDFNRKKKIKRDFERFNFDHCLNYNIHSIILIATCKSNSCSITIFFHKIDEVKNKQKNSFDDAVNSDIRILSFLSLSWGTFFFFFFFFNIDSFLWNLIVNFEIHASEVFKESPFAAFLVVVVFKKVKTRRLLVVEGHLAGTH